MRLSGEDREKCAFTLGAKATNLNRHGAAIFVNRDLVVGSTVLIGNGRGTQVAARVVSQALAGNGMRTYGIEFLEEGAAIQGFWGIIFPGP